MAIVWKLRTVLEEHRITPNALAEHVKGRVSRTAIYNLVQVKPPTSVHFETLDVLIPVLTELTGQSFRLFDLLEYRESGLVHKTIRGVIAWDMESDDDNAKG